eukprot:Hpha_TRINITY_DN16432_c0_g7::TRINITY_DN16432_c0_g7_i1::g.162581::m.162581
MASESDDAVPLPHPGREEQGGAVLHMPELNEAFCPGLVGNEPDGDHGSSEPPLLSAQVDTTEDIVERVERVCHDLARAEASSSVRAAPPSEARSVSPVWPVRYPLLTPEPPDESEEHRGIVASDFLPHASRAAHGSSPGHSGKVRHHIWPQPGPARAATPEYPVMATLAPPVMSVMATPVASPYHQFMQPTAQPIACMPPQMGWMPYGAAPYGAAPAFWMPAPGMPPMPAMPPAMPAMPGMPGMPIVPAPVCAGIAPMAMPVPVAQATALQRPIGGAFRDPRSSPPPPTQMQATIPSPEYSRKPQTRGGAAVQGAFPSPGAA